MKKFFQNSWFIGIATGIIASFLSTLIIDIVKKISLLSTLKAVLVFVWKCIISFLNFDIKVWWLLIAVGVLAFVLWIIVKYNDAKEENDRLAFLNYTQDSFNGQWWEWTWKKNWEGKYAVDCLHPICNKCKTALIQEYDYYEKFRCPRCNLFIKCYSKDMTAAETLIYDNIKKNCYKK